MDSRRGVIEEFLAGHPGRFCADCIGLALDIPARQVSMARQRLTAARVLSTEHARCSGCNRLRLVIAPGVRLPAE